MNQFNSAKNIVKVMCKSLTNGPVTHAEGGAGISSSPARRMDHRAQEPVGHHSPAKCRASETGVSFLLLSTYIEVEFDLSQLDI